MGNNGAKQLEQLDQNSVPAAGGQQQTTAEVIKLEGPLLSGQDKWLGGALGADGVVYGVPGTARTVLRVDPRTSEVSTFGGPFDGKFKWLRGVSAAGEIYCIPANAHSVLVITPGERPSAKTVGHGLLEGDWLYHGGAADCPICPRILVCIAVGRQACRARRPPLTTP